MKAIGLIRVSTQAQQLESQSIKVKEAMLKDGFSEPDIILIEDKESGSKLSEEERAGLNRLKRVIETEEVGAVYAYEISRISRRASIVFSIRDYLIARHIQLVILNPFFRMLKEDGTMSETSNIFFGIFSSMSENETLLRTERIMRGKERKRMEGKLSCGKPIFGYKVDKDKYIIPDPVSSKVVQEIFERYANLESSGSIGKDMWFRNALPTKSNKLLTYQTYICVILKDGRYCKKDSNSIYPAIISKELFNKVQEIHASKPDYFIRKSRTQHVYPLQGFIYTEDGYVLSPSISNNRYLKMDGASKNPISLNMKAVHGLSMIIMNQYLNSGVLYINREHEIEELSATLDDYKVKIIGIDGKIQALQEENDRINSRIIKGRLSEKKGDVMMDKNIDEIHTLEDERQSLIYNCSVIDNKLAYLANPMFNESLVIQATNEDELKEVVNKYLSKVIVKKLDHSKYELTYLFNDHSKRVGGFYSYSYGIIYYDENGNEIKRDVIIRAPNK